MNISNIPPMDVAYDLAEAMRRDRVAAGMIREYIPVDQLIGILGLTEEDFLRAFPALTDGGK
jgi:hypothetical protein